MSNPLEETLAFINRNSIQIPESEGDNWINYRVRGRNAALFGISGSAVIVSEVVNQIFLLQRGYVSPISSHVLTATNFSLFGLIVQRFFSCNLNIEQVREARSFLARTMFELLEMTTQVQLNFAQAGGAKYGFDAFFYALTASCLTRDGEAVVTLRQIDRPPYPTFEGNRRPILGIPTSNLRRLMLMEGIITTAAIAVIIFQSQFTQMNVGNLDIPNDLASFLIGAGLGKLGMHGLIKLSDRQIQLLRDNNLKPLTLKALRRFFTIFELTAPFIFSIPFAIKSPIACGVAGIFFGMELLQRATCAESEDYQQWRDRIVVVSPASPTAKKVEKAVTVVFFAWLFAWFIGVPLLDTYNGNPTQKSSWILLAMFIFSTCSSFAGASWISSKKNMNLFWETVNFLLFDTNMISLPFLYGFKKLNMNDDGIDEYWNSQQGLYLFALLAWMSFGMTFGIKRAASLLRPESYSNSALTPPIVTRILGEKTIQPFIDFFKGLSRS